MVVNTCGVDTTHLTGIFKVHTVEYAHRLGDHQITRTHTNMCSVHR